MPLLEEAIASGQVSADQIEANRAAGDLPIVMFDEADSIDAKHEWCFNAIQAQRAKPQTLREAIDSASSDDAYVLCRAGDVRAALLDAERYKYAIHEMGAYAIISGATDWLKTHLLEEIPSSKESVDLALDEAIKGAQS